MSKKCHDSIGLNAQKTEFQNKSRQWCEYDKLARMGCKRESDIQQIHQGTLGDSEVMRMIYKEEWRVDQEVGALSLIARQDSNMQMSGRQSIGSVPSGQLLWEGSTAELSGIEEEELGTVYSLTTASLQRNPYNSCAGDNLWRGIVDHKAEAATASRKKIESLLTSSSAYDPLLFSALNDMSQLIHLCEINMKRKKIGKSHATDMDPFIHCCSRMAQQRKDWMAAAESAVERNNMDASCLLKVKKAGITLQKIQAFRQSHNNKQSMLPAAKENEVNGTAKTDKLHAASTHSSRAPSPHLPNLGTAHKPRTITPSTLEEGTKGPAKGANLKLPKKAPAPLSRHIASFRIQRWWRKRKYWRTVTRKWVASCRKEGLLDDARYRQQLEHTVATTDMTSLPMMCVACVKIQKVFRGWQQGRKPCAIRQRAVMVLQRVLLGSIVRRYRVTVMRDLRAVKIRHQEQLLLKSFIAEDRKTARSMREYAGGVINLETELARARRAVQDEESNFKKEWKMWEEKMTKVCLTEVPLDSEWSAQTQSDGTKQYLNLKTKRITSEHPNLRLAEIHRKRQWVKVGRVRSEHKTAQQAHISNLENSLERIRLEAQSTILSERKQLVYTL